MSAAASVAGRWVEADMPVQEELVLTIQGTTEPVEVHVERAAEQLRASRTDKPHAKQYAVDVLEQLLLKLRRSAARR